MSKVQRLGLAVLHRIDPETAHGLALRSLQAGLGPRGGPVTSERLRTRLAGLDLANPIGLAAGFDKNAEVIGPLSRVAFGFLEVGAVTPNVQHGNPRPRLFRLPEDRAAINRFGFNNDGMEAVAPRLGRRRLDVVLGLNLGANKDSHDRAADFATVLTRLGPMLDFATVNVSSPNTEHLRDLQGKEALTALLAAVMAANSALARPLPVFVKIAPDLKEDELADIAQVSDAAGLAGIVATNTTISREGVRSKRAMEKGGLSGRPLFEKSTRVVAQLSSITPIPVIGVGGIGSAEDAYAKIRAGASAVQLYTALVYGGLMLARDIAEGLDRLLARDGFANVAEAVGTDRARWL